MVEKYQLAGLDERERGFNRLVEVAQGPDGYRATFRYETTLVQTACEANPRAAVLALVNELHARGYSQMRTRLSFQGETYLGSQAAWEEHSHPGQRAGSASLPAQRLTMLQSLFTWFRIPASRG